MTQYELIDLWVTHWNFAVTAFVAFLSATSALLIVATLKGKELEKNVYRLVVYLYLAATIFFIGLFAKISEGIINLRGQLHEVSATWYNVVYEPQFIAPSLLVTALVVQALLAGGSLWYFRSTRRR